jgi:hypothetical protein
MSVNRSVNDAAVENGRLPAGQIGTQLTDVLARDRLPHAPMSSATAIAA